MIHDLRTHIDAIELQPAQAAGAENVRFLSYFLDFFDPFSSSPEPKYFASPENENHVERALELISQIRDLLTKEYLSSNCCFWGIPSILLHTACFLCRRNNIFGTNAQVITAHINSLGRWSTF